MKSWSTQVAPSSGDASRKCQTTTTLNTRGNVRSRSLRFCAVNLRFVSCLNRCTQAQLTKNCILLSRLRKSSRKLTKRWRKVRRHLTTSETVAVLDKLSSITPGCLCSSWVVSLTTKCAAFLSFRKPSQPKSYLAQMR